MQTHLPDYFFVDLLATVAFGIVAILLIIVGYIAFDKLTPKLDFDDLLNKGNVALPMTIASATLPLFSKSPKLDFDDLLNKGNVALAIVIGSFIIGLCYVVGKVVSAVLG